MKKREALKHLLQQYYQLFQCPVCGKEMRIQDLSFVCTNWHSFDLSTRGYINLLLRPGRPRYDTAMLTSRHALCASGFFDPMIDAVSQRILRDLVKNTKETYMLVDAGCGEGSHLSQIAAHLCSEAQPGVQGVGIDISKEGIRLAARGTVTSIWCVADLSRLPLQNHLCDSVINILAPANYREFQRVLKEYGILIKIIPGRQHLTELREVFFDDPARHTSDPEQVVQLFSRHFTSIETYQIVYSVTLPHEQLAHLIAMTPLSWNVAAEKRQRLMDRGLTKITVDLHMLVGKKSDVNI